MAPGNDPGEFPNQPNAVSPGSDLNPSTRLCPTIPAVPHIYQPDDQAMANRTVGIRRAADTLRRSIFELQNFAAMVGEDAAQAQSDQALVTAALSMVKQPTT